MPESKTNFHETSKKCYLKMLKQDYRVIGSLLISGGKEIIQDSKRSVNFILNEGATGQISEIE